MKNISNNCWLFDLDNTIHDASEYVFPSLGIAMSKYISKRLNITLRESNRLRDLYWKKYGATVIGLNKNHCIDPIDFLNDTHKLPLLESKIKTSKALKYFLKKLNGKKYIFSNSPKKYCLRVLKALNITYFFDGIMTLEVTKYNPKPSKIGFLKIFKEKKISNRRCIMIDDDINNLLTAKKLGLKTILINKEKKRFDYIDFVVKDVLDISRIFV